MTSLISETQSGSPFFAFLVSIFNEDAVKKAVTDRANVILVPGAQAAAEESATAEKRTALNNADTKLADAIAKASECHAADKDVLAKGAAAKAAARAYLAADAASPTPASKIKDADVEAINLYAPDSIKTACNNLHESLTGKRL